jgi:hypothetical protein
MIHGEIRTLLTPKAVLKKISAYDVFKYYMPDKSWKLNKATLSPFRMEKNPSFLIGSKTGSAHDLTFIDFGDDTKKGDCFTFVKMLFNLPTIHDVLLMIDRDFGLGFQEHTSTGQYEIIKKEYKQPEELGKRYSFVQVVTRKFNSRELNYWKQFHQGIEDLKENNVYAVKKVFLNRKLFYIKEDEMVFGYYYENDGGRWKIYRPYEEKKNKWVPNNVPITTIEGITKPSPILIINKSKKDYMVMKKVFPDCCAVQNESSACFSEENVNMLKANSERQFLSFDADDVGVKHSRSITKLHGFEYVNVPRKYLQEDIKDWADLSRKYGLKAIESCLREKQIL